jgi:hypothetical protein
LYFCTILKSDTKDSLSYHRIQSTTSDNQTDTEVLFPSYDVCSINNIFKSNTAGGTDNTIPELIKYGGRTLKQRIYNLITMICEKEQLLTKE